MLTDVSNEIKRHIKEPKIILEHFKGEIKPSIPRPSLTIASELIKHLYLPNKLTALK